MSTPIFIPRFIALVLLVTLVVTGCGLSLAPASEEPQNIEPASAERERAAEPAPATAGEVTLSEAPAAEEPASETIVVDVVEEESDVSLEAAPADSAGGVEYKGEAAGDEMAEAAGRAPATPAPVGTAVAVESEMATEADAAARPAQAQSGPLRAGEVDDNAQWDDYLLYRRNAAGLPVHERDVSERYMIEVKDGQGYPVLGANVRIFLPGQQQRQEIYSARTYANGRLLFHPLAVTTDLSLEQVDRFLVEVQKDDMLKQFTLTRFTPASISFNERWEVTLDLQQQADSINLDVLFLIDATGSMADEIAKIQSTIFDVSARIDALPGRPDVRYGMVTYRDRDDAFVTKTYDFTPDVRDFSKNLNTVFADGGGDYPESLNEGLHQALHGVEWRGEDTIQLIFLIADAPPHLNYAQDYDYAVEMEQAARRAVKIFPIASSGLDDQGEYIFRQIAQFTQGRFIFLTYEGPTNSGSPGDTTTHHVEDYSVSNLDELLVRLVEEELAYQTPQLAAGSRQ